MIFRTRFSIDLNALDTYYPKIPMFRIAKLIKCLGNAAKLDGLEPDNLDEHDNLFVPKDDNERKLWEICRGQNKKDIICLKKKIDGGAKGGKKPLTQDEKKNVIEQATARIGKKVGENQIEITDNFHLPAHPYFDDYRKEYPAKLITSVEKWIQTHCLHKIVDYTWIGKLIQNFNKRNTGKVL